MIPVVDEELTARCVTNLFAARQHLGGGPVIRDLVIREGIKSRFSPRNLLQPIPHTIVGETDVSD